MNDTLQFLALKNLVNNQTGDKIWRMATHNLYTLERILDVNLINKYLGCLRFEMKLTQDEINDEFTSAYNQSGGGEIIRRAVIRKFNREFDNFFEESDIAYLLKVDISRLVFLLSNISMTLNKLILPVDNNQDINIKFHNEEEEEELLLVLFLWSSGLYYVSFELKYHVDGETWMDIGKHENNIFEWSTHQQDFYHSTSAPGIFQLLNELISPTKRYISVESVLRGKYDDSYQILIHTSFDCDLDDMRDLHPILKKLIVYHHFAVDHVYT